MIEELEAHGLKVFVYRSPEDDTPVIQIDTPGTGENEVGPLFRLYVNDALVYENPPYPGVECERYGEVDWTFGDVTSLDAWKDEWTPDQAEEFLQQHYKLIRDRLTAVGFEVMEDLLATWTPEGKTNGEETIEEESD